MKAHECLLKSNELLDALRTLRTSRSESDSSYCLKEKCEGEEQCFVELALQSPELVLTLNLRVPETDKDLEGVIFVILH